MVIRNALYCLFFLLVIPLSEAGTLGKIQPEQPFTLPYFYLNKINLAYPQIIGMKDLRKQAQLNTILISHLQSFLTQCIKKPDTTNQKTATLIHPIAVNGSNCSYKANIVQLNNALVAIQYDIYYHSLGQQGSATTYKKAINYAVRTGKVLIFSDLFKPNSNYLSRISKLVQKKLNQRFQGENIKIYEAGVAPKLSNYQNFLLDKNALVIFFQPLQVAADYVGVVSVAIPYNEIRSLLK